jgi:hypothetical protein
MVGELARKQPSAKKPQGQTVKLGFFHRSAKWLAESPVKTVVVAVFASVAFLIAAVGGAWNLYKDYKEASRTVSLRLRSVETVATMRLVTAAQMSEMESLGPDHPLSKMGAELPIMAAALEVDNPTAEPVNVRACFLTVKDKWRKPAVSERSYSAQALREFRPESPPIWRIDPRSIKTIERSFSFSQAADVAKALATPDSGLASSRSFEAACLVDDKVMKAEPFTSGF